MAFPNNSWRFATFWCEFLCVELAIQSMLLSLPGCFCLKCLIVSRSEKNENLPQRCPQFPPCFLQRFRQDPAFSRHGHEVGVADPAG